MTPDQLTELVQNDLVRGRLAEPRMVTLEWT
jgi:hypothetical protein